MDDLTIPFAPDGTISLTLTISRRPHPDTASPSTCEWPGCVAYGQRLHRDEPVYCSVHADPEVRAYLKEIARRAYEVRRRTR